MDIVDVVPCFINLNLAVVTTRSVRTLLRDDSTEMSGWMVVLNRRQDVWKITEIAARDLDQSMACR